MKNPNVPTDTPATVSGIHPAVVGFDVNARCWIIMPDVRPCPIRGIGDVNARRWITLSDVRPCLILGMSDDNACRCITLPVVRPCCARNPRVIDTLAPRHIHRKRSHLRRITNQEYPVIRRIVITNRWISHPTDAHKGLAQRMPRLPEASGAPQSPRIGRWRLSHRIRVPNRLMRASNCCMQVSTRC